MESTGNRGRWSCRVGAVLMARGASDNLWTRTHSQVSRNQNRSTASRSDEQIRVAKLRQRLSEKLEDIEARQLIGREPWDDL